MSANRLARSVSIEHLHLLVATAFGLLVAVFIGLNAVGLAGNPLSSLMRIVGVGLLVFSTVNPRFGLKLLIISGACLDLVKRFLVFFDIGSFSDVLDVLAVAPVTLTGVFLGTCVFRPIFTKRMLDQTERRLVYFSLLLIGVQLVSGIRSEGGVSASVLGNAANKSAYSLLVPIIYVLYRRAGADELRRLLQFTVIVFAIVAIYGIQQQIFGFNQFEIDYMRSGLSTIGEIMYDKHPRPFSTLNSPHAFSVVMAVFSILSFAICLEPLKASRGFFESSGRLLLPLLFFIACFLSFVRSSWLLALTGIACIFVLRTRARTIAFYSIFVTSFGLLVWQAENIYASLDKLQAMLPQGSDVQEQAFRLGTYSERLYGFQNVFRNRVMWTWFGNPDLAYKAGQEEVRDEVVHDALGQTLVSYGFIGLFALLSFGSLALVFLHRRVLGTRPGPANILGRGLISICIAIIVSGMVAGSHVSVFPINLLFWFTVGALLVATQKQSPLHPGPQESPEVPLPPMGRRQSRTSLRPA